MYIPLSPTKIPLLRLREGSVGLGDLRMVRLPAPRGPPSPLHVGDSTFYTGSQVRKFFEYVSLLLNCTM